MTIVHYISGGARSGKSSHAETAAMNYSKRAYLATGVAFDKEMQARIDRHKKERGLRFVTVEEPVALAKAIESVADSVEVVLVDCLTVWLNNLMFYAKKNQTITMESHEIRAFLTLLENPPVDLIIVSNELGMGIVPEHALAREYRDIAGFLNQAVARRSAKATLMVSGIPLTLKELPKETEG